MPRSVEREHSWHHRRGSLTFALILLAIGTLWLLSDLKIITISIPWIPVILILIAVGMIINNFRKD
jgi:hypothetical protein